MNLYFLFKTRGKYILISLILLYFALIIFSDVNNFGESISKFDWSFFPILLMLIFFSLVTKSERQKILLKKLELSLSRKESLTIFLIGQIFVLTPGGLGNTIKTYFFKDKHSFPITKSISVTIMEKYFDLFAIGIIISTFTILTKSQLIFPSIFFFLAIFSFLIILKNERLFNKIKLFMKKNRWTKKFIVEIEESHKNTKILLSNKNSIHFILMSVGCWLIDALIIFVCFISLGIQMNFFETTIIGFIGLIAGIISFIPGGIGITEISIIAILTEKGIELSLAASLVIIMRLFTVWSTSIVGVIVMSKTFQNGVK